MKDCVVDNDDIIAANNKWVGEKMTKAHSAYAWAVITPGNAVLIQNLQPSRQAANEFMTYLNKTARGNRSPERGERRIARVEIREIIEETIDA